MKKDYLWDKIGTDAEIERLENALVVFRYQETEPPALPAKIIPFERKTPRGFFRIAFAFAGFAALIAVGFGVWFQLSSGKIELARDAPKITAPTISEKTSNETQIAKSDVSIPEKVESSKLKVESKFTKIRIIAPPVVRQNKLIARRVEAKKPAVKLTTEEKFAYGQLLLALSITGSKLQLVKDKIDGIEEKTAVSENGRQF